MNGLIRFSLGNPRAVTVLLLTIVLSGVLALAMIPADILPVYRSPAVQVLTFYNGMAATSVESGITARMERGTGQAAGILRQESRSLLGVSIVRNFFADDIDPAGALTRNAAGQLTGGFGAYNLTVANNVAPSTTANGVVGQLYQQPRQGTIVARFTF